MIRAPFAPTWAGWRVAARRLLHAAVPPHQVEWRPETEGQQALDLAVGELPREGTAPVASDEFRVPRAFVELAGAAACHRDPARWGLLYRVLWRLCHGEPRLLDVAVDPDVHRLLRMEKAVRRASHKMKAFVRFRAVEHDGDTHYVAWFEPEHDVLARVTPFFTERFASMRWSILTPDGCAHWDRRTVRLTAGVTRAEAPSADALEGLWRTYYASTFNPARVRTRAMRGEMPRRYWKNLPEADLIVPLVQGAAARVREMVEAQHAERQRAPRPVFRSPPRSAARGKPNIASTIPPRVDVGGPHPARWGSPPSPAGGRRLKCPHYIDLYHFSRTRMQGGCKQLLSKEMNCRCTDACL